jgi:hypothetical protein
MVIGFSKSSRWYVSITFGWADYRLFKAVIEEKLADAGAEMAFAGVKFGPFISLFFSLGEQAVRPFVE